MKKRLIALFLVLVMVFCCVPPVAQADEPAPEITRTIMLYDCGADLEGNYGMATWNLYQVLKANFSASEKVRFVVMTGGALEWWLESEYLYDPATGTAPEAISGEYNQIWEAYGLDAVNEAYRGKLVLLDGDGVSGDGEDAVSGWNELMTDPETLKAFINYSVEKYPAEKYDLILWDHGGGPDTGFGIDMHEPWGDSMSFAGLVDALSDNAVTRGGGKFDFIDFDACLMGSAELLLGLADYMDYYISSPETEPGYGQDYTGWLNALGKDPGMNGFDLGKIVVDDFISFYTDGEGAGQSGTLGVIDVQKLFDRGFIDALIDLTDQMAAEAKRDISFYDELSAAAKSIGYGSYGCDLGTLTGVLGVAILEGDGSEENAYTQLAKTFAKILSDETIVYDGATADITGEQTFWINADGKLRYEALNPSGLYLFFPPKSSPTSMLSYYSAVTEVIEKLPANDPRTVFLSKHLNTALAYTLIELSGTAVTTLIKRGMEKSEVGYDEVKAYWLEPLYEPDPEFPDLLDDTLWSGSNGRDIEHVVTACGGEEAVKSWLDSLIRHQAVEAIDVDNIRAYAVDEPDGTGYIIEFNDTTRRVIESVNYKLIAELPIAQEYLTPGSEKCDEYYTAASALLSVYPECADQFISETAGSESVPWDSFADWQAFMNATTSTWELSSIEEKWYAVKDADGILHMTQISDRGEKIFVACMLTEDENGDPIPLMDEEGMPVDNAFAILVFTNGKLSEISCYGADGSARYMTPSTLKKTITFTPVYLINVFGFFSFYVPISPPITVSPENFESIELVYTDIDNIPDIQDANGDGEKLTRKVVATDIYGAEIDISEAVMNPVGEFTSVKYAEVPHAVYNGKTQKPQIVVKGKTLTEGVDYSFVLLDDEIQFINAGEYKFMINGIGDYTGFKTCTYIIEPALTDVPAGEWYADAVGWALAENITFGTSNTTFSPNANCTRGQIVTFLWRAAGSPFPEEYDIPFTDVDEDSYCYLAVAWAVENGITVGTSATTFSPNDGCTRAQIVTFLWRAAGKPDPVSTTVSFTDVSESYYYPAVLWAVENGVTVGTSATTFSPDAICTRAQSVTFLYRNSGE